MNYKTAAPTVHDENSAAIDLQVVSVSKNIEEESLSKQTATSQSTLQASQENCSICLRYV